MKNYFFIILLFILLPFSASAAYLTADIYSQPFDTLTGWSDASWNGCVASISPPGYLYFDANSMTGNGACELEKDFGTIGSIDYYIEYDFWGDIFDGYGDSSFGLQGIVQGETNRLKFIISNGFVSPTGSGILIYDGTSFTLYSHTWNTDEHTIVFYVHNSQTDVDIWIDKDPSGFPDISDLDASWTSTTDGDIQLDAYGTPAGNGDYHVNYLLISSIPPEAPIVPFEYQDITQVSLTSTFYLFFKIITLPFAILIILKLSRRFLV